MQVRPRYRRDDLEQLAFHEAPSTSSQDLIGLRTNDTSTDVGYPSKRYTFLKKMGDGSASTIHLGLDKETNDRVVIKMISKRDDWRIELGVLKKLSTGSLRILKYLDYFESQKNSYIVTEFYPHFDLFGHIDINVPYSEKMAYMLLLEMAKCVKECHDKHIVHLDIKCENFMVRKENLFDANRIETGNVVLIDFGHAEEIDEKEEIDNLQIGYNHGTTFYLSPEGYQKVYSSKSDIWSLGICASLLLTGDYPFYGDEREYMWNAVHEKIHLKNVSERSRLIVTLCLSVDPRKRPSIDQLIDMLERGLSLES